MVKEVVKLSSFLVLGLVIVVGIVLVSGENASQGPIAMADVSDLPVPHVRSSFSPKSVGDDAQARFQYELMRLRDPATGRIPPNIRERELAFVRDLPRADELARKTGRLLAEQWSFRGPTNQGGRTRALKVDLDYNGASNQRILAGGISGGIFLSEDDGQSWSLRSSLSHHASVTCLAQDPSNHDVWYFGSGELLAGSADLIGQGIFKSTDRGRTWSHLLNTRGALPTLLDSFFDFVWNIAVHPNGGTVFAATFGGIQRSTDGGSNWEYVLGRESQNDPLNLIVDVAIASDGDIYATLSRNGSGASRYGVFKSTNVGDQWQDITPPTLANDPWRMVLGPAQSDANTLYLLVQVNQEGAKAADHQLFRYNDANGTWTDLSSSIPNEQGAPGNATFSTQGGYDQLVSVKPDDAETVFIGGTNLYRSTNGGSSFTRIGGYLSPANYAQFDNHHSDQHSLAFLPTNPNVAISGNDGGLAKSSNILAEPHSWTSINNGYVTTQFYTIAIDPQPGGRSIIGGMQDNGTYGTDAAEGAAEWTKLFGGDGAHAAIAPGATAYYVSSQNGDVLRLTPSGFAGLTPAGAQQFIFVNPFVLDPNDPRVMYMGEAGGVWRNSNLDQIPDGSQDPTSVNWTFMNSSAQSGSRTTTISAAKTPANRIYFGTTDFQSQFALTRVDNADSNGPGTQITPPIPPQQAPPYVSSVAINPNDGDEIIATFSNYNMQSIWYSTNAGGSWTNIDGNLGGENGPSVRAAAIVPTSAGKIFFVGTSTGIYSTTAPAGAGTTWALEGGDVLGNVVVDMFAVRPEDGTIVAGSHGRGVYQATIGQGGASAVATLDVNGLKIEVQPGATESATFTLTNSGTAPLNFNIGASGKTGPIATKHVLQPDPSLPGLRKRQPALAQPTSGPQPERASVTPTGESAGTVSSGDLIILDDGTDLPDDFFGWGDGFTPFQWGSHFFAPVGGFTLESVFVYMRSETFSPLLVTGYITDPEGNVFVSGSVNLPVSVDGTWHQITFDPIALPEGQAFDVEFVAPAPVFYPAGVDANGQVPGSGYYWVNSGLDGFYAELSSVEGFENGTWLIRAEGTAGGGSLNQPPIASIQPSRTQAVVNESITFDGSGSRDPDGSVTQYAWAFGDGGTSTRQTAQHAFSQAGSYTVTLTVTDNEGATGQTSVPITVTSNNQLPVARIQASKNQAEVNEEITFDGSGSSDSDGSIAQHAWAFGDGATSNQPIVTHAFGAAGGYTVALTVTDNEGGTGIATTQINILAGPSRLTVTPLSGTLGPGESQLITVTYDASTQVAGSYSGQVSLSTNGGNVNLPVTITVDPTVDVEAVDGIPERFVLDQNYPNPFNPETTIQFTLEQPSNVRLVVFDLTGRAVRTLIEASKEPGPHSVKWDGRDASGESVASGTYFYWIEATSANGKVATHFTRKMTLLR